MQNNFKNATKTAEFFSYPECSLAYDLLIKYEYPWQALAHISEFILEYFDSGYFAEMMDTVSSMISPYVEKDPTKFCTYEEFEAGTTTLKEFCLLRAESISGQLDGSIGATSDTQESDTLIDASAVQMTAMGSMHNTMDGNRKHK